MASSFMSQIPIIIYVISKLKPTTILDIGKGFGKYSFLTHEYLGIDNTKKLNPKLTMKEQSTIKIDAVEIDEQLMLPHLNQFYSDLFQGNILEFYEQMKRYDLILMIDVIEHLDKTAALNMLKYFSKNKTTLIVATPYEFFNQHLYESEHEEHVSHWTINDFKDLFYVDLQKTADGVIYLLTSEKKDLVGFGNSFIKKIKRIARAIKNEF